MFLYVLIALFSLYGFDYGYRLYEGKIQDVYDWIAKSVVGLLFVSLAFEVGYLATNQLFFSILFGITLSMLAGLLLFVVRIIALKFFPIVDKKKPKKTNSQRS